MRRALAMMHLSKIKKMLFSRSVGHGWESIWGLLFPTFVGQIRYLQRVPLRSFHLSLWWIRKGWFTRPRPLEPSVVVPLPEEAVTRLLDQNDFEPGWPLSYNYRDEIFNLRRVEYVDHPSGFEWWQVHIRGYNHPDGIEVAAHFEPEPRKHPRAHITLFGLDVDRGMETLTMLLDEDEIEYAPLNPR